MVCVVCLNSCLKLERVNYCSRMQPSVTYESLDEIL